MGVSLPENALADRPPNRQVDESDLLILQDYHTPVKE